MTQVAPVRNSDRFGFPVRLRGVVGNADVVIDTVEHQRRQAAGQAGRVLGGMGILDALLQLPEQVNVRLDQIDPAVLAEARRSAAALDFPSADTVRRVGRPAASAALFTLTTSDWRRGLAQLHRLAAYCPRRLYLTTLPRSVGLLRLEASYWGIGVTLQRSGGDEELLVPGQYSPSRYSGAAWAFDEALYAQAWRAGALDGSRLDRVVA